MAFMEFTLNELRVAKIAACKSAIIKFGSFDGFFRPIDVFESLHDILVKIFHDGYT